MNREDAVATSQHVMLAFEVVGGVNSSIVDLRDRSLDDPSRVVAELLRSGFGLEVPFFDGTFSTGCAGAKLRAWRRCPVVEAKPDFCDVGCHQHRFAKLCPVDRIELSVEVGKVAHHLIIGQNLPGDLCQLDAADVIVFCVLSDVLPPRPAGNDGLI